MPGLLSSSTSDRWKFSSLRLRRTGTTFITSVRSIFDSRPEDTVRLRSTGERGARHFGTTRRGKESRTERELFVLGSLPRSRDGNNPSTPPSLVARRFNAARDGETLRPQRKLCVNWADWRRVIIYVFVKCGTNKQVGNGARSSSNLLVTSGFHLQ